MKELFFLVEESPEGGFTAKALGQSIFTEAETLEELKISIKDAVKCHYDNPDNMPVIIRLHMVKEETITI